ncbi:ATP-grasp domain-containing protein [Sinomonas sp. G460-2]|uniref:ATP-grasp domain-containing protein n=1 Tax=Sinomonas sp. G460-2 TaxID=3393464 RepID=UPI0039F0FEF1
MAIGLDCDPTIVHFLKFCRREGVEVDAINLREVAAVGSWNIHIGDGQSSLINVDGCEWNMLEYDAVYARPIDLTWSQQETPSRSRWFGMMSAVRAWLQTADILVINRPMAGVHNSAKPLHEAFLAGLGFRVPDSVTSADPRTLREFVSSFSCILKSLSGTRGDTVAVTADDLNGFVVQQGPLHVQRRIEGVDVRVHVLGDVVLSTMIDSRSVDYRAKGVKPKLSRWLLPIDLSEQVVAATRRMGLTFAGWDFKVSSDGIYWCLEANPQPGYGMYDPVMEWGISRELVSIMTRAKAEKGVPGSP